MDIYASTLEYFYALSSIPRRPKHEELVRDWLIAWAEERNWEHETDETGNLLIRATGKKPGLLCLQAHMDMVCVADHAHDFETEGITILDDGKILRGDGTTLWADNGIGVAAMMAVAEMKNRPSFELLFTMAEEVGLIGAQNIEVSLKAPYAINLDWCDSRDIGIGCGGTLLIKAKYAPKKIRNKKGKIMKMRLTGMQGGHSGVEIKDNRGNAIIEICKILSKNDQIVGISELKGGDTDNSIPRNAKAVFLYTGNVEKLEKSLKAKQRKLRKKYENENIKVTVEKLGGSEPFYDMRETCRSIVRSRSGVDIWHEDGITPLSSWNLGKIRFVDGIYKWCYFIRTNILGGIQPMKKKILSSYEKSKRLEWGFDHELPVWYASPDSPFVQGILASIRSYNKSPITIQTMHATMEAGMLSVKYPDTQWVSMCATCHDMHTTREHIYKADLKEFCGRLERVIVSYN